MEHYLTLVMKSPHESRSDKICASERHYSSYCNRAFYEAQTPVAETDLKVPYICLNGAEVRDESFNIMSTSHLNHDLVHKITTAQK